MCEERRGGLLLGHQRGLGGGVTVVDAALTTYCLGSGSILDDRAPHDVARSQQLEGLVDVIGAGRRAGRSCIDAWLPRGLMRKWP
jgi:hypothetical protein